MNIYKIILLSFFLIHTNFIFIKAEECLICQTSDKNLVTPYQCNHYYHKRCINRWLHQQLTEHYSGKLNDIKSKIRCPYCNSKITNKYFDQLTKSKKYTSSSIRIGSKKGKHDDDVRITSLCGVIVDIDGDYLDDPEP